MVVQTKIPVKIVQYFVKRKKKCPSEKVGRELPQSEDESVLGRWYKYLKYLRY